MGGYSWCVCTVRQSSFRPRFPPATNKGWKSPCDEAWPRPGWVQTVQSSNQVSSRSLQLVKGNNQRAWLLTYPPHKLGYLPIWVIKILPWEPRWNLSCPKSSHSSSDRNGGFFLLRSRELFSPMPPWWDVSLWYPQAAVPLCHLCVQPEDGDQWDCGSLFGWAAVPSCILGKQAVLASIQFTIIPPLFASSSAESVWVLGGAIM